MNMGKIKNNRRMLSRYITYFPLNYVTYTFRQASKKQEISLAIVIIVSVIVIDKVFTLFVSLNKYQ